MSAPRPGWREPMVWLLFAIPLATVAAGFATLRVARAGSADTAPEPVRRTLQAQVTDLSADAAAARLGLAAGLRIDAQGRIGVTLPPQAARQPLVLRFVHPTRAALDRTWTRARSGATWRGPAAMPQGRGHWILEDAARRWRLVGQPGDNRSHVALQPAVPAR